MIAFIVDQILGPFWPYIAGAAALVVAFVTGRVGGAAKAKAKQSDAALKATTKGAEAARKGRAEATEQLKQGKTPEEIVRGNDDAWR
jgi:hypothetical protein